MLRKNLSWLTLAALALLAWPLGEPRAAGDCSLPYGVYVLELVDLELLEGDALVQEEEARLEPSTVFDSDRVEMRPDEVVYFERTP